MACLDITVKNKYSNYLFRILEGIDLSKYEWEIITDDTLYFENRLLKQGIFNNNRILTGDELLSCISRENYYMIFVDIKAYLVGKEGVKVQTFDEFLKSNCILVFICTDSSFIEVYCKDKEVLEKIRNNCIGDDFEKVDYLDDEDVLERNVFA